MSMPKRPIEVFASDLANLLVDGAIVLLDEITLPNPDTESRFAQERVERRQGWLTAPGRDPGTRLTLAPRSGGGNMLAEHMLVEQCLTSAGASG
jgi:hypothetical protein